MSSGWFFSRHTASVLWFQMPHLVTVCDKHGVHETQSNVLYSVSSHKAFIDARFRNLTILAQKGCLRFKETYVQNYIKLIKIIPPFICDILIFKCHRFKYS